MLVSTTSHPESTKIYNKLIKILPTLTGGTQFTLAGATVQVEGKDGLGGLIEEWFGVWANNNKYNIHNPKSAGGASQNFPDYFVGEEKDGYLEIKTFNADATPAFDIANFESYCESLSTKPFRLFADYLIFSYKLNGSALKIEKIWLKKIWQITCASGNYPLKTQTKRNIIYNIRPSSFHSRVISSTFPPFNSPGDFVDALYNTQEQYNGKTANRESFAILLSKLGIELNDLG